MQEVKPKTNPHAPKGSCRYPSPAPICPSLTSCGGLSPTFGGRIDQCPLRAVLLTIWLFSEKLVRMMPGQPRAVATWGPNFWFLWQPMQKKEKDAESWHLSQNAAACSPPHPPASPSPQGWQHREFTGSCDHAQKFLCFCLLA